MPRSWATALLCAYADVLTAVFWPGPVNGLTVLFILFVDAVLFIALIAVPGIRAATRDMNRALAMTHEDTGAVQARQQFIDDLRRATPRGQL